MCSPFDRQKDAEAQAKAERCETAEGEAKGEGIKRQGAEKLEVVGVASEPTILSRKNKANLGNTRLFA